MKVDRSFATSAPVCLVTLAMPPIERGKSWGELTVDVTKQVRDRSDCLKLVAEWYAAERDARTSGAPGA